MLIDNLLVRITVRMSALLVAAVLAGAAGYGIWTAVRRKRSYDLDKIPGPVGWPLLGSIPHMVGPMSLYSHQLMADLTEKYGPVVKIRLGPASLLLVTDPVEVAALTSNSVRQENLPKLKEAYRTVEFRAPHYSLFGTPDAEEWKSYRKTLNPAFSPENIRKAYPKILSVVTEASNVLHQLCQQGPVDISKLSARLTADLQCCIAEVIGSWAFDEDLHCLELQSTAGRQAELAPQQFVQARASSVQDTRAQLDWAALMSSNVRAALLYLVMPWLAAPRKAKASMKRVRQKEDSMAKIIAERGTQPLDNTSLWACLSRLVNYKTGEPACHDSLAANVGFLFTAGYETTAHLVNWALFELAANKDIQERVRVELQEAGLAPTAEQPQPRALEFADLTRLSLLDSVVRETLRLHATAPNGTTRQVDKNMVIGGYRVPKGTIVQLPNYPMHLSPFNFIAPTRFWPRRWTTPADGVLSDTAHPDATPSGNRCNPTVSWNPFSCGPRNCAGQTLALAEARTTLAIFLARFSFELPAGVDREAFLKTQQVSRVTLQPKDELLLAVKPLADMQN